MTKLTELYEEVLTESNNEELRTTLFQMLVDYQDEKGYKFDEEMDVNDFKNLLERVYNKGLDDGWEQGMDDSRK